VERNILKKAIGTFSKTDRNPTLIIEEAWDLFPVETML